MLIADPRQRLLEARARLRSVTSDGFTVLPTTRQDLRSTKAQAAPPLALPIVLAS
ncbi:hypothetical protein VDS02_13980 [Xanthomonas campestris pv. campestris]|uniref:hypothetical protein n=1 Tax=Xanthomonas campestris TaxID=339 RepID=UPI0002E386D9|nr:hypothetical protein [Xanthomonas campestris]MCF8836890.1 hypothetical protein [Xanthomonas campestris pv. campestris]MCF8867415.1 hypothetical protein [Xanthomonas campestris pv. campestris]MCF8876070.1 hypothetical protein [Xanthomonas campestris pv. campestris]MDM7601918.1 hypothetical protein [Xanthomonas campestris pv. campestris]MDM7669850.1 hypothetical protein [Xanthomonas campestris pv. campestris]